MADKSELEPSISDIFKDPPSDYWNSGSMPIGTPPRPEGACEWIIVGLLFIAAPFMIPVALWITLAILKPIFAAWIWWTGVWFP